MDNTTQTLPLEFEFVLDKIKPTASNNTSVRAMTWFGKMLFAPYSGTSSFPDMMSFPQFNSKSIAILDVGFDIFFMFGNSSFSFAQYKCLGPWVSFISIDNMCIEKGEIYQNHNFSLFQPFSLQHKYLLQVLSY